MSGKGDRLKIQETAERLVKSRKLPDAIAQYEKLLDGTAQDIPIRNIIGDLYVQLGREDQAIKVFRTNIAALEKQGSYSQALAISKRVSKYAPSDVSMLVKMGDLYSLLGFGVEAKTHYLKAAAVMESGDEIRDLIVLFEKLVKLDRNDLEMRIRLARLYAKVGSVDRTISELNDTADVLFARGDTDEALRLVLEAQKIRDVEPRTLTNLSRILAKKKKLPEAVAMVEQALRKTGPRPELHLLLGNLCLEAREDEKARDIFQRMLAEDADDASARVNLGVLELRAGHPDLAYALYEPILALMINRNKDDQAVGLLGTILFQYPTHEPSLEKLAAIFRRTGRADRLEVVIRMMNENLRKEADPEAARRREAELKDLKASVPPPKPAPPRPAVEAKPAPERAARPAPPPPAPETRKPAPPPPPEVKKPAPPPEPKKAAPAVEDLFSTSKTQAELRKAPAPAPRPAKEAPPAKPAEEPAAAKKKAAPEPKPAKAEPKIETKPEPKAPAEKPAVPPDVPPRADQLPDKDQEIIRINLSKADLYVEQGLLRNAKRILDNLHLLYPDEPRVMEKIAQLSDEEPASEADLVSALVERVAQKERTLVEEEKRVEKAKAAKPAEPARPKPVRPSVRPPVRAPEPLPDEPPPAAPPEILEALDPGTVSIEDIFSGTDLLPSLSDRPPAILYPDLSEIIRDELQALESAFFKQIKDKSGVIEKDLTEIVDVFKKQVEQKIEKTNYESRYNLGVAFLEQGLYDEAVAEFQLAAEDTTRAADAYALCAECFRRKKNFREALRWIEEALRYAEEGSDSEFALTYERADLLEDLNENEEALSHYRRVMEWNSKYRDVAKRVKILEKITS